MEKEFLDKVKTMWLSGYGLRRHNKRRVIAWWRDICQNYGISFASV
ncbi:hypothetical protein Goari_027307 [Gossypium aridum]|uniref:Uncharacterized protein n=2 Tax=Gossypium aridum TaxID=34290 RepID=A0A7J8YSC3_GOSAI|nr:hypothetical protein [Gossypium aridum]